MRPGEWEASIEEAVAQRLEERFAVRPNTAFCNRGSARLELSCRQELAFSRSFAMRFVAALCSRTGAMAVPPPPLEELTTLIDAAPPMPGGAYLHNNPLSGSPHAVITPFRHSSAGQIAL